MATQLDIYNQALAHLGIGRRVSSLSDAKVECEICNQFYETARDQALSECNWNFARVRQSLADTDDPPSTWDFSYTYPTDCLSILALVVPGLRWPRNDQRTPYEVASDGTRAVIYTDLEDAEAIFIKRETNTALFSPLFVAALSRLLAFYIAPVLSGKQDIANLNWQIYRSLLMQAAAQSQNENWPGEEPYSDIVQARQ